MFDFSIWGVPGPSWGHVSFTHLRQNEQREQVWMTLAVCCDSLRISFIAAFQFLRRHRDSLCTHKTKQEIVRESVRKYANLSINPKLIQKFVKTCMPSAASTCLCDPAAICLLRPATTCLPNAATDAKLPYNKRTRNVQFYCR